ncbi:uncharacterized mitochondrial protein AtMg00310-like [Alnus glutinosa]|uniref:uncharacterized mitochondrial protein AtMg00310-like n=1 Tax=Alnus glutinosa TaxID=3517 RepID=UPI002D795AAC|nr:uncharacterized mitochondrial protein AtMg00310-like [Alnus glutinosa]
MGRSKSIGGLGFRDLVVFNKALLAKQGWRILQDSNFVAAQILKAKYFPKCTFLEAPLGSKPSFAWRTLFNAKDLLSQGLIWRIGNGKSVKIWGDKWLPTPTTYVAELIDEEQGSWKELPLEPCLSIVWSVLTKMSMHFWPLQLGEYGCVEILSSSKVNLLTQMQSIMKQLYPLKSSKDAI